MWIFQGVFGDGKDFTSCSHPFVFGKSPRCRPCLSLLRCRSGMARNGVKTLILGPEFVSEIFGGYSYIDWRLTAGTWKMMVWFRWFSFSRGVFSGEPAVNLLGCNLPTWLKQICRWRTSFPVKNLKGMESLTLRHRKKTKAEDSLRDLRDEGFAQFFFIQTF